MDDYAVIFTEVLNHLQALWDGGIWKQPYPRAKVLVDANLFEDIVSRPHIEKTGRGTAIWATDFGRMRVEASTNVKGPEWALVFPGDLEDWETP